MESKVCVDRKPNKHSVFLHATDRHCPLVREMRAGFAQREIVVHEPICSGYDVKSALEQCEVLVCVLDGTGLTVPCAFALGVASRLPVQIVIIGPGQSWGNVNNGALKLDEYSYFYYNGNHDSIDVSQVMEVIMYH